MGKEYMSEEEILENYNVRGEALEELLAEDVVTSKMENGRRVFAVEEIKIRFEDTGKRFQRMI